MVNGISLVVQWLRLHASTAGDTDLIPGWRIKIPYAMWCCQKREREKDSFISIGMMIYKKKKKTEQEQSLIGRNKMASSF